MKVQLGTELISNRGQRNNDVVLPRTRFQGGIVRSIRLDLWEEQLLDDWNVMGANWNKALGGQSNKTLPPD